MKKMIIVFAFAILFASCAKKEDYSYSAPAPALASEPTHFNSIPYDKLKQLSIGEYSSFRIGSYYVKAIKLSNGYLITTATSEWSDAGITSIFIKEEDF